MSNFGMILPRISGFHSVIFSAISYSISLFPILHIGCSPCLLPNLWDTSQYPKFQFVFSRGVIIHFAISCFCNGLLICLFRLPHHMKNLTRILNWCQFSIIKAMFAPTCSHMLLQSFPYNTPITVPYLFGSPSNLFSSKIFYSLLCPNDIFPQCLAIHCKFPPYCSYIKI